jgi:hypothetical protein
LPCLFRSTVPFHLANLQQTVQREGALEWASTETPGQMD